MTQLDAELEDAIWAGYRASGSDAGSEYDEAAAEDFEGLADAGPGPGEEPIPDLDDLVEALQGIPAGDAVDEVRETLKKAGRGASDADLLGVLLKVFRMARDSALEGYDTWDCPVSYCDELTRLCDRNFVGMSGGGGDAAATSKDFPPMVVAAVYAECGRTLLLSDDLRRSRVLLEKATNVFAVIPDGGDENVQRQAAAARASLARVTRRQEGADAAQVEYLRALEIYAKLPAGEDLADFLSEHCEVMGQADADSLSPSALGLLADIAEDKFGTGSDEHLEVLRQIADTCSDAGRVELAAPALACRARALLAAREEGDGGWTRSDVEAALREAAAALEAALPARLQGGDLEGAIETWQEAIAFRELLEGPDSSVVGAMRQALESLVQVHAAGGRRAEGEVDADAQESDGAPRAPPPATAERWDEECEPPSEPPSEPPAAAGAARSEAPYSPPPRRALAAAAGPGDGLRPAWMRAGPAKPPARPEQPAPSAAAAPEPAVSDAWD